MLRRLTFVCFSFLVQLATSALVLRATIVTSIAPIEVCATTLLVDALASTEATEITALRCPPVQEPTSTCSMTLALPKITI